MFIKKITNKKQGKVYIITYRRVKSKRIDGIPRHIKVLDLGSLSVLDDTEIKLLAKRIEELSNKQTNVFDGNIFRNNKVEQTSRLTSILPCCHTLL